MYFIRDTLVLFSTFYTVYINVCGVIPDLYMFVNTQKAITQTHS